MTRRTVALSLAVAVVWVTPVASGPGPDAPPPAESRGLVVSDWASAGDGGTRSTASAASGDGWMVSDVIDAGDAVLVGADWGGDHDTEVQVRARDEQGWGDWIELHVHEEHIADTGSPEAASMAASTASDPVFLGRIDDLQFRVDGTPPELDVQLVDIEGDLSWTPDQAPAGAAVAATEFPMVRPRASWGADESIRSREVSYADDVRFSVIHHEGGAPRWSEEAIEAGCQSADDAIRAIYKFHVQTRGYWDIAYNFIVDPCGGIWEGRAGGIDKAVMGAHAGGWNSGSVGVLALGTFTDDNSDPVTDEMVESIEKLLAWKLDIHHADTRGTVREISGGGSSRYREGTAVDVPILSAHQITNSTSCPGAVLMDRLFTGSEASATPRWSYATNVYRTGLPKAFDRQPDRWTASEAGDRPSWEVTTTEPVDWSLRITDEDGELVRATGGTDEDLIERTWDLRDSNGNLVDAGTYDSELTGVGDTGEITPVTRELVVSSTVTRRMGGDRVATSVALSEWAFESADVAIVASSEAYPDALVSGPLAGSLDAPVLLTPRDDLPESVEDELERLGVSRVYVIGGEVAIGASVQDELESDLDGVTVERIGGGDRFETAAMVADLVIGDQPVDEVLLSLGHHENESSAFPDALSAGAFGADLQLPVLLTRRDDLPDHTRTALRSMSADTVRAFGGTVAITDDVTATAARVSGASVERFAGDTRYDTSRLAAEELLRRRGVLAPGETAEDQPTDEPTTEEPTDGATTEEPTDGATTEEPTDGATTEEPTEDPTEVPTDDGLPIDLIFASGGNWPDALGAGAAAAKTGTVFLLAHPTDLDAGAATRDFLDRWESRINDASVAGGPVAIKGAVLTALAKYVKTSETVETEPIPWPSDPHAGS